LKNNPYLFQIHQNLPRLLALLDADPSSLSYGQGDRRHWAWGLSDFGNGAFQGAANGLSILVGHGLLPDGFSEEKILRRIQAMFHGADKLRRRDGSLEEAFPYEGSFCVTSLVAYDLLSAIEQLGDRLASEQKEACLEVIRPMIGFLLRSDETHAIISNHLATAVAALCKWHKVTDEGVDVRVRELLDRILENQSDEGWFMEYEGADPGYQSLCTYYLADVHRMRPDFELAEPLRNSLCFLWHFAHPDGSYGGFYGSRNTRFYFPAGIECLAGEIPEAAALATHMRRSIEDECVVTLSAMDEPNLIPMFNSYCLAVARQAEHPNPPPLPCRETAPLRRHWQQAGLYVDRGESHYTIVSTSKGGVLMHFEEGERTVVDGGMVAGKGTRVQFATQSFCPSNQVEVKSDQLIVHSEFRPINRRLPTPWHFIILRCLNLSVMRFPNLREWVKRLLVRLLITRKGRAVGGNRRVISLGAELQIEDEQDLSQVLKVWQADEFFTTIHMASRGYWQIQDDS
jgi:hypothetical protein